MTAHVPHLAGVHDRKQTLTNQSIPWVALCVLKSEKYVEELIGVLRKITGRANVIYVTTNKPYTFLQNSLEANHIEQKNLFFIDCISKHVGAKSDDTPNCYFIRSPQDLVEISIAVSKTVEQLSGEKILLLDSLSILLMYNDAVTVGKFSNFLINRMRLNGVSSVILALESDAGKDLIKQVTSIADEVKTFAS